MLLDEVLEALEPQPGSVIIDGTLGGGGHAQAIADLVGDNGLVISLDRDERALLSAEDRLRGLPVQLVHANYCDTPEVLSRLDIEAVDGVLLDLGLSSDQLADRDRGFSFDSDGPLDLRFDTSTSQPAWQLLARLSEKHLADLIYQYGEERHSRRIARKIVATRRDKPVRAAADLSRIVRSCVGGRGQRIDPATRTFQALRIAVNDELKSLDIALRRMPDVMRPGGRLAIISFHSLEDRPVKNAFRDDSRLEVITKKPIRASEEEIARNPRARSAKLRVAQRVA